MKILFLTDNFPPEVNAPASRTYEHCKVWVDQGIEVTIITCVPNFPFGKTYKGYKNKFYQTEVMDGIKVVRVWSFMVSNEGFFLRTLDFISFSLMSFITGLFVSTDIVMATSPQFFTALSGRALSFFKRKPFVLEIRDLWPEQLLSLTKLSRNFIVKYFEWEELKCYKRADLIVSVTDSYVEKITKRGINNEKFVVVKNGVDREKFKPRDKNLELLKRHELEGKFVIGFIGTHGLSQNLVFIIDCISDFNIRYRGVSKVHFLFIGEGADKENVVNRARVKNISNISFLNQIEKNQMPNYLSLIDVSLVPLRKSDLYKSVIPSKIFELAAMNIPILLGVDGEARNLVERYDCGVFFEPEDSNSFIVSMLRLIENKESLIVRLKKGGESLAIDYERKNLAIKLLDRIISI